MFPIRCYTCGRVIGNKYESFKDDVTRIAASSDTKTPAEQHEDVVRTLHKHGIFGMCCKAIFLSHVEDYEDRMAVAGELFRLKDTDIVGTEGEVSGGVRINRGPDRRSKHTVLVAR